MSDIICFPNTDWNQSSSGDTRQAAVAALEVGKVLLFPQLAFRVPPEEQHLLSATTAGQAKNVSLNPATGDLRGHDNAVEQALLRDMMLRFARTSSTLLQNVLAHYFNKLQQARTSYRPVEVAGRAMSWHRDDTRLHVDSFPSSPTQGQRILRVFCNINPDCRPRSWRIGEPFQTLAQRFLPRLHGPFPGASLMLNTFGITKRRRSAYDHYMLRLHDSMKADVRYQREAFQQAFEFPAGSTWIVYTDQVSHAAMGGQHLLEQTFHLPVDAMLEPGSSPLRQLERMLGRKLV